MRVRATGLIVSMVGVCLVSVGCGGSSLGDGLIEVSGLVTFEGEPLTSGVVSFVPADVNAEGSFAASGLIEPDGRYVLRQSQSIHGVRPGEYRVRVESWKTAPTMEAAGELAIPAKYFRADTSGLRVTVESDPSEQTIDLPLGR